MSAGIYNLNLSALPIDEQSKRFADAIAKQEGVQKVVLFPDSFTKDKYLNTGYKSEVPSSVAIATDKDVVYPQFRSRGFGSGMSIIALPLGGGVDLSEFNTLLSKRILYSLPYYFFFRARLPIFPETFDISLSELHDVVLNGPEVLQERFSVGDISNLFTHDGVTGILSKEVFGAFFNNKWLFQRTTRLRHSLGRYFGGNHFFEVGFLKNIRENTLGIYDGQRAAFFHAGSEALEDVVREDPLRRVHKN